MMIAGEITSKTITWLSFTSQGLVYIVMIVGAYVSSVHQGLLCPDWPLCPNGFGFPKAEYLIEYLHRIIAISAASVIYATAVYTLKKIRDGRKCAVISTIVVSFQILLGVLVVKSKLDPLIVATHLSLGSLLFAITLVIFLSCCVFPRNK